MNFQGPKRINGDEKGVKRRSDRVNVIAESPKRIPEKKVNQVSGTAKSLSNSSKSCRY